MPLSDAQQAKTRCMAVIGRQLKGARIISALTSFTVEILLSNEAGRRAYSPETLFLVDALNMIEALGNLNHLIKGDAEDAQAIRSYVSQSEDILRRLAALVCSRHSLGA